jgi:DNA-binding NarL/FixJ family response regulator
MPDRTSCQEYPRHRSTAMAINLFSHPDDRRECAADLRSTAPPPHHPKRDQEKITVLLVDDHALVRRGFRRLLEDEDDITVVGEAEDGQGAVQLVRDLSPRIVLMDYSMPGDDGVQATKEIARSHPDTTVLILSMYSEDAVVRRAIDAGARGYILKQATDLDLVSAIKRVLAGELVLDSRLYSGPTLAAEQRQASGLTTREIEVLRLIVQGNSGKDIARLLGISLNTVSAHRNRIGRTLGCRNSAELVACAIRRGLVQIP